MRDRLQELLRTTLLASDAAPSSVPGGIAWLNATLKPFDPQTKNSGVLNLYLHTALAHVRSTVGEAFPTVKLISDDNA